MKARKKLLALFLAFALLVTLAPAASFADEEVGAEVDEVTSATPGDGLPAEASKYADVFVDMPDQGYWATSALEAAIENNILAGFTENGENYIKPEDPLTRAQMATIINRAFGASAIADLSGVEDVSEDAWYYENIQKAVKMGTMVLDKNMYPDEKISRQEAYIILARALKMEDGSKDVLDQFKDGSQVSDWAAAKMGAMVEAGYAAGYMDMLTPRENVSRAEIASILDSIIKQYIIEPGIVSEVASGNIMVNVAGVTLEDVTISGDLIIGDGVAEGTVTLKDVVVEGKIITRSGKVEKI